MFLRGEMTNEQTQLNDFMVNTFYKILEAERRALEFNGLTLKEIHLIDAVYNLQKVGQNNFSSVAGALGITLGTMTSAFAKLERKGYLKKTKYLVDQRIFYITCTPKCESVHKAHTAWHEKLIDNVLKFMPGREMVVVIDAFRGLEELVKTKIS